MAAVGVSQSDERRAWCRLIWQQNTGREPTAEELDFLVYVCAHVGADQVVAGVYDGPQAAEFRARRGW